LTVRSSGKLKVAGEPAAIAAAQRDILHQVQVCGYDARAQFAIRLALDEAACNAMRHGNAGDPALHVTFEWQITDEQVTISVADEGPGFDPDAVPDPTAEENLTRPCGRGVMLMRQYMTDVSYSDQGRRVTMVKRRDCRRPLPHEHEQESA
jgi:serine/threonine-protein kinase RsbW